MPTIYSTHETDQAIELLRTHRENAVKVAIESHAALPVLRHLVLENRAPLLKHEGKKDDWYGVFTAIQANNVDALIFLVAELKSPLRHRTYKGWQVPNSYEIAGKLFYNALEVADAFDRKELIPLLQSYKKNPDTNNFLATSYKEANKNYTPVLFVPPQDSMLSQHIQHLQKTVGWYEEALEQKDIVSYYDAPEKQRYKVKDEFGNIVGEDTSETILTAIVAQKRRLDTLEKIAKHDAITQDDYKHLLKIEVFRLDDKVANYSNFVTDTPKLKS